MVDISTLYTMISSSDKQDIVVAVALINENISCYSSLELEYLAYLVPSEQYALLKREVLENYIQARHKWLTISEYEKALPQHIYDLRMKVIHNISYWRYISI